jgi:hypothetical protein
VKICEQANPDALEASSIGKSKNTFCFIPPPSNKRGLLRKTQASGMAHTCDPSYSWEVKAGESQEASPGKGPRRPYLKKKI